MDDNGTPVTILNAAVAAVETAGALMLMAHELSGDLEEWQGEALTHEADRLLNLTERLAAYLGSRHRTGRIARLEARTGNMVGGKGLIVSHSR